MAKLFFNGFLKFLLGLVLVGLLLFLPAGSFSYWNAWLLIGILFIPMFIVGVIMLFVNQDLLRSRLNVKEKENEQKVVVALSGLMFICAFVIAGLNYRYKWFEVSEVVVIIAAVVFVLAYILYGEVLRENTFLSRTIEVKDNQKIVDTGLYGIVRHPMYMITIVLFLAMPLILGSPISFVIMLIYPFIIVKRIKNEEKVLDNSLLGYKEYKKKVKYRLIPYIW